MDAAAYDFTSLSRRQLQQRCKQAGLRANTTNKEMAEALQKLAQAEHARKDASLARTWGSTASKPESSEHVEIKSSTLVTPQAEAGRDNTEMEGEDLSSQEVPPNPGYFEGLQPALTAKASLLSAVGTESAAIEEAKVHDKEKKTQCDGLVATDKRKEPAQLPVSKNSQMTTTKGSGSLIEELLAATDCEGSATLLHRKLAKSEHIGKKGREDRLKRAADKGALDRGALLAEKRGSLAKIHSGSQESAPVFEDAQELSKPGQQSDAAASEKQGLSDGSFQDRPIDVAGPKTALDGTQPVNHPEDVTGQGLAQTGFEEASLALQTPEVEQLNGEEGAENEASEESESGSQKENQPPLETAPTLVADSEAPLVTEPAEEQQGNKLERGSFSLSEKTFLGSIMAKEERVVLGQSAHKACYKSRPFSAKGVERRALAAVKKGAAQREGILAERRMMP